MTTSVDTPTKTNPDIIIMETGSDRTLQETEAMFAVFDTRFASGDKFGVIFVSADTAERPKSSPEVANYSAKWLKQKKPQISACCVGIATVLPNPILRATYNAMMAVSGTRMMGCPTRVFADVESAQVWLAEQLQK